MTLRARLLLALLAMALLPIAAFTLFSLDQLDRSTRGWFRPGVERALGSALDATRSSLLRVDAVALARAQALAPRALPLPLDAERRAGLRQELGASGLDLLQLYVRTAKGWQLMEQITPAGVLAPDEPDLGGELEAALDSSGVLHSPRGVLAGLARPDSSVVVLVGAWVAPDFFEQVRSVSEGVSHYGRLGVLVPIQRRYVWLLVTLLVLGLAGLAVAIASQLARGMSRPLRDLSGALEQVAAGDLSARVTPGGARELARLGESFNSMTARLETAREDRARAEREAAWRDVARHLAHEIKNPLTAMRYALHRIERRVDHVPAAEREPVRESLEAIVREVKDLAFMADQFAQYARRPEPRFEPLDLGEVARNAAALQEPDALTLHGADQPLPVLGDRVLLSRAVQNLILNALEASPAGARVEVQVARDATRAMLEVRDRGAGLPAGPTERLFEPYVSTKNRGSGMGLSLVRDVAQQHEGGIALEAREGGGVCARLWLPLRVENVHQGGSA